MKKMNAMFVVVVVALIGSVSQAQSISLQCQFLAKTKLQGFSVVLDEETAKIRFDGSPDENGDMNPAGESVVLENDSQSSNWSIYRGLEVVKHDGGCTYYINFQCAAPARGFVLNFAKTELQSSKIVNGGLAMTRMSGYVAGETYVSHTINCIRQ